MSEFALKEEGDCMETDTPVVDAPVDGEHLVGQCEKCGQSVWLTPGGACPFGHPASAISKSWSSPAPAMEYPEIRYCKTCGAEMYQTVTACPQCGFNPKQGTVHCRMCGAPTAAGQIMCTQCGHDLTIAQRTAASASAAPATGTKNRTTAGILALILGGFGAHKFYMGYSGEGMLLLVIDMIIVIATGGAGAIVTAVVPFVEGIAYLRMSDEEFQRVYIQGHKAWF